MPTDSPVETVPTLAYKLRGIPYVPHYIKRDCFISPGRQQDPRFGRRTGDCDVMTERELIRDGAKRMELNLWPRNSVLG